MKRKMFSDESMLATASGDWDESKHPRGQDGRFGDSGGDAPSVHKEIMKSGKPGSVIGQDKVMNTKYAGLTWKGNADVGGLNMPGNFVSVTAHVGAFEMRVYTTDANAEYGKSTGKFRAEIDGGKLGMYETKAIYKDWRQAADKAIDIVKHLHELHNHEMKSIL